MSELINNREHRRNVLKQLIAELHSGKSVEDVKKRFEETFEGVSASEISEVEQALIMDGMPITEVQRLCDVHAAVFKGSIEDIHKRQNISDSGHPVDIMKRENRAIEKLISVQIMLDLEKLAGGALAADALKNDLNQLWQIDIHYLKKENVMFPYLEKYGISAPPKVMWGVDDEVRGLIKQAKGMAETGDTAGVKAPVEQALAKITEMIFKEENILFPMMVETLAPDEWKRIAEDSRDLGFCLIDDAPEMEQPAGNRKEPTAGEGVVFPTGSMQPDEITALLNTLPFDLTFVDKQGTVKYFSQGKDRIFPRTKAVIGRKVTDCHPPASVHIVENVVADLMSGAKEHEDFWLRMGERYVFIRYYAVRGDKGEYLGTLEVTQDIAPIQAIQGEKRLMTE